MSSTPLTEEVADEWWSEDHGESGSFELETDVDEVVEDFDAFDDHDDM